MAGSINVLVETTITSGSGETVHLNVNAPTGGTGQATPAEVYDVYLAMLGSLTAKPPVTPTPDPPPGG